MSLITRVYSFTDGTVAYGSQVDAEIATIVNALNSLDNATTTWTNVKVTTLLPQADVSLGGHKITNLGTPTTTGDAVSYPVTNSVITAQTIRGSTANSGGSAQEISQGTISTVDLRTNAVTVSSNSTSGTYNPTTTITSAAITTIGKPVLITYVASISILWAHVAVGSGYDAAGLIAAITCDGTEITGSGCRPVLRLTTGSFATSQPSEFVVSGSVIHTPSAAAHTYALKYDALVGTGPSVISYSLTAVELRA